jgi:predicted SAM-dependent methyltransferase
MNLIRLSKSLISRLLQKAPVALSESEALDVARKARSSEDWGTVLATLGRVTETKKPSLEFLTLKSWALARAGRLEEALSVLRQIGSRDSTESLIKLQDELKRRLKARDQDSPDKRQWERLKLGKARFGLAPNDAFALTQIVMDLRPQTILEVGSCGGGAASWLQTLTNGIGSSAEVHSADWGPFPAGVDKRVRFYTGDLRDLSGIWPQSLLEHIAHPCLLLLRSQGGDEVSWPALTYLAGALTKDDVICVVNEPDGVATSAAALARFALAHPVEYGPLESFESTFGAHAHQTSLICLKHTGLSPLSEDAGPGLEKIRSIISKGDWDSGLDELNSLTSSVEPRFGVNFLRAVCLLNKGLVQEAVKAASDELRHHPEHRQATAMLSELVRNLFPGKPRFGGREFYEFYRAIRQHSILSDEQLYSIYLRVRLVCQMDVPGDIVECGIGCKGAAMLISSTIAKHSRRPRQFTATNTLEAATISKGTGDIAFLHLVDPGCGAILEMLRHFYTRVEMKGFIQISGRADGKECTQGVADYGKECGVTFDLHPVGEASFWFQRQDRKPSDRMRLNLGCGIHFHPAWINIDIAPANEQVIPHNLAEENLPFDNQTCAAVYHSHVLEHIPLPKVRSFIDECFRVLATDGILRIVVPDLENIARLYLTNLEAAARGDEEARHRHEWMIMELVDQLAREAPGGQMAEYWRRDPMPAESFVYERVGWEAKRFVEQWRAANPSERDVRPPTAEEIGRFRIGGEVHKWMWDRIALAELLKSAGFVDIKICAAAESSIDNFASYLLDADAEGRTRKPDSLFVEARRPKA